MNSLIEYVYSCYQDPMFLMFPVYTTLFGLFVYLLFALPLSAIAHYDPPSLRKYRISEHKIDVGEYFSDSLRMLFTQNFMLLCILCVMWPLTIQFGVHAGDLPPWYIIILQLLIFLFVDDFLTYWAHKAMHIGWLYKHVHAVHHKIRNPSAMDNAYFHWLEYLIIASTGYFAPLLMGAHIYVIWIWVVIRISQSVFGHCGYEFPWNPLKLIPLYEGGAYHYFHHIDQRGNMSGILPYLDRIFGKVAPKYRRYKEAHRGESIEILKLKW